MSEDEIEERYMKINRCFGCEHLGHTSEGSTSFCIKPSHQNLDIPKIIIGSLKSGDYYPIIESNVSQHDTKIPDWCDLPDTVGKTIKKEVFINIAKTAIMTHFQDVKEDADLRYLNGLEEAMKILDEIWK